LEEMIQLKWEWLPKLHKILAMMKLTLIVGVRAIRQEMAALEQFLCSTLNW
jgi:hypothetical protein